MANYPRELYNYPAFFRLIYGGQTYAIREPEGWDKMNIKLQREKELYGFNYEFADPQVTLTFATGGPVTGTIYGGDLIDGVYNLHGQDGEILFQYGYIHGGEKLPQFTGRVNLNTRKNTQDGIVVQIEKRAFNNLLNSRYETKVDLSAIVDLDGKPAPACPVLNISLHSKNIVKTAKADSTPQAEQVPVEQLIGTAKYYIQPDTLAAVKSELEEMQNMPAAFFTSTPQTDKRYQYIAMEVGQGTAKWTVNASIKLEMSPGGFGQPVKSYLVDPQIMLVRDNVPIVRWHGPKYNDTTIKAEKDITLSFEMSEHIVFQKDDELYFFLDCSFNAGIMATINYWNGSIEITQETSAPVSSCIGYRMFDAITNVVHKITGVPDAVVSSFFGSGGCAERFALTNGFKLRNFAEDKPVMLSLKDIIEGAAPIWNIGEQNTQDANGNPRIKIEPAPAFFGSKRIMDFDVIAEYEDEHEKEVTYNEVEIGYTKYSEDEVNTLDDVHTVQQWLLPVTSYKFKYVQKSNFITSGYLIEQQRRNQFAKSPSTSMSNDDNIFIIAYIGDGPNVAAETNQPFGIADGIVSPSTAYNLRIAPIMMLYNHSAQINICLDRKPNDAVITNTFTKSNNSLRLQYMQSEPCKLLADNYIVQSKEPIPLDQFNGRNALYMPRTARIKVPDMHYADLMYIKERLLGESGTDEDYGTVGYRDRKGVWWHGYIWELSYEPASKNAVIIIRAKGKIV